MPEDMSDGMPEDLPVTKCINVIVGITRSKVFLAWTPRRNHKFGAQIPRELGIHGNLFFLGVAGLLVNSQLPVISLKFAYKCLWMPVAHFFLVASWISSGLEVAICLFEHWVTQSFMVNHHVLTFTPMLQYFMGIYHSSLDKSKDIQR